MITAQEAFESTIESLKDIDITDILIRISSLIEQAAKRGAFAICSPPIEKLSEAEKLSHQLSELGYSSVTITGPNIPCNDGTNAFKQSYAVHINWREMPRPSREYYGK